MKILFNSTTINRGKYNQNYPHSQLDALAPSQNTFTPLHSQLDALAPNRNTFTPTPFFNRRSSLAQLCQNTFTPPSHLLPTSSFSTQPSYIYPSFGMNPKELKGIDRFVSKKYNINPQEKTIKTLKDFQEKCKSIVNEIFKKDFSGRQEETKAQRKAMLNQWYDYVVKENGAYTGSIALMILGGITAGLKPNEDTLPPVLNKGVLAKTVDEISTNIPENPDDNAVSFDKKYRLNLQNSYLSVEKEVLDENLNGWIVIPSKENDPDNFDANVDKLKMLSHDNWCTKSFNAKPYLKYGDFHIYMENGRPKLGVRFVDDEIEEIQGELNNSKIPIKYGDIAKEHIKNYELSSRAKKELVALEKTKEKIKKMQKKFPKGINNYPVEEIFEKFGIECKKDRNIFSPVLEKLGLKSKTEEKLIISHYTALIDDDITYSDLGIDENRLIKNVKRIEGNAYFKSSNITSLGSLKSIGGDADSWGSQITSLGNLESIGGNVDLSNSQITSLGNLKSIGGDANFEKSKITSLGNVESIGGSAYFVGSQITSLGNLKSIGGNANFKDSQITSLGNLESIGGDADFWGSQITSLDNLESIGGNAYFGDSQITNLGNLKSIGGWVDFSNSKIASLGKLESIGGDANFRNSQITSLGNLKSIGGNADFWCSQITSLGKLESIRGWADFENSIITSLGNLKSIGENANFRNSQITSLGNLKSVGNNVYILNSKLTPEDFASVKIGGGIIS